MYLIVDLSLSLYIYVHTKNIKKNKIEGACRDFYECMSTENGI